ncbi:unnamed protein product [Thlaspi arvense]|uniref:Uncharacterized protein n=1 Tax=Thlaspi arvense TaxID=13288 RepID=A0AAU9RXG9_THLAR|nr:unnamed protein product [Thlaspi arvense]
MELVQMQKNLQDYTKSLFLEEEPERQNGSYSAEKQRKKASSKEGAPSPGSGIKRRRSLTDRSIATRTAAVFVEAELKILLLCSFQS